MCCLLGFGQCVPLSNGAAFSSSFCGVVVPVLLLRLSGGAFPLPPHPGWWCFPPLTCWVMVLLPNTPSLGGCVFLSLL